MVGGHVPLPPGERWRVQAVTAQADGPAAGVESDHAVMNVAFRGPDEESRFTFLALSGPGEGAWFEDRQAAALADGDITAFGLAVNTADLRPGGARRTVEPVGPGLHERVYTSSVTLPPGEGMSYEGIDGRGTGGPTGAFGQVFHFHGRYQPYGLYLPAGPGPHGLGMIYHGSNQNHSQLVNLPGLQQQVAEDHGRILAAPLARGVHGYGADISERDLLDVRDDVLAAYDIDSARTIAAGYSQGGYVTLRQAALHPDHYAGLISWVGFTGDDTNPVPTDLVTAGAVGNAFDLVGNHLHIPAALLYGGADELIPVTSSAALAEQYRTLGSAFRFYLHPTGDHFQLALLDEWGKESAWLGDPTAATDPLHVRFRAAEVLGDVEVGVRHDTAHWVSQLRGRATVDDPFAAEEAYIDVDLRADGCGGDHPGPRGHRRRRPVADPLGRGGGRAGWRHRRGGDGGAAGHPGQRRVPGGRRRGDLPGRRGGHVLAVHRRAHRGAAVRRAPDRAGVGGRARGGGRGGGADRSGDPARRARPGRDRDRRVDRQPPDRRDRGHRQG